MDVMRSLRNSVLLVAAAMLWATSSALAGGWSVTTLDAVSSEMEAGQAYQIGYVMRQHGVTPVRDGEPRILLSRADRPAAILAAFPGRADGAPGHYVSDVTFPSAGDWLWAVDQHPFPITQTLGSITIAGPPTVAQAQTVPAVAEVQTVAARKTPPPAEWALLGLALLGLGGGGAALLQARRMTRPTTAGPA